MKKEWTLPDYLALAHELLRLVFDTEKVYVVLHPEEKEQFVYDISKKVKFPESPDKKQIDEQIKLLEEMFLKDETPETNDNVVDNSKGT